MKKIYSFMSFVALITTITTHTMDPERHPMFKLLDQFIAVNVPTINWEAIFVILEKLVYESNQFTVNEYRSNEGSTLLYKAAEDDDIAAAKKLLLKYRANPNISTATGMTPLMAACYNGNVNMVKMLLEYGADPSKRNNLGNDSFYFAQRQAHINHVRGNNILRMLNQTRR